MNNNNNTKKNMKKIQSETNFLWKFVFHILLTPFTLILVLFKKKEWMDLLLPFKDFMVFIFEPKFTISIIILNFITFVASFFLSQELFNSFISYPSDFLGARAYTLLTSGFLHASWSHLLWNMLAIFIFGRVVERKLGFLKTNFIYFGSLFVSGIFSSLIDLLRGSTVGGLGASGAIMGLVSAAILLDPFYIAHESGIPLPIMINGWLAIYADLAGILNPTADGIGHFAHLGGFISIGLLTFFLSGEDTEKLRKGLIINIISLLFGIAVYFLLESNVYSILH